MFHKLRNKYSKRSFVTILVLLLCIFSIALWYVNENQATLSSANYNFLQSLLIALVTSIVTTTFLGALYWFLLPKEVALQQLKEIDPQTTIEYFDDALSRTSYWGYHGHIGRWVRNAAFNALIRKAREKGEVIRVELIILDPTNLKVCNAFTSYTNTIRFREKNKMTTEDIRSEIFTTILKSVIANQSDSLNVRLFIYPVFESLRKDISDTVVFLTRVDPRAPALAIERPNNKKPIETMYSMLRTGFEYSKNQSRELRLESIRKRLSNNSSLEDIGNALIELKFFENLEDINKGLLKKIDLLMKSNYHPYN